MMPGAFALVNAMSRRGRICSDRRMTKLRFGIFMAPFHPAGENPTLALQRDLELIERLDQLGYDEAWIGEHHSAGSEIIASPEVFIAAAAERTKRIRLGTGVSSLPYHHPPLLADRMLMLAPLTGGRASVGVGPGALASDAYMLGIEPAQQRDMMEEALEAIIALPAVGEQERVVVRQRRHTGAEPDPLRALGCRRDE